MTMAWAWIFRIASVVGLCALGQATMGCRSLHGPPVPVEYRGHTCWRMHNGTVEVVVNPATGRIVRYGYIGGRNILWENPKAGEQAPGPKDWKNWGGDKVWPWPQDAWLRLRGRDWPPPGDGDIPPYDVAVEKSSLKMTSAELPGLGLRVVRVITLASSGSKVTIRNRLEPVGVIRSDVKWAAWTITQTAIPPMILARLDMRVDKLCHPFPDQVSCPDSRRMGDSLQLVPAQFKESKVGLEADRLAAVLGDLLFLETVVASKTTVGAYVPGEKAQLYIKGCVDPDGPHEPYLEMELTSPCADPWVTPPELTVEWQLHRLSPAEQESVALHALVERL